MRVTRYMCAGFMTFFGAPAPAISGSLDQEKKMSFMGVIGYICAWVLVPFAALQAASMAASVQQQRPPSPPTTAPRTSSIRTAA